jgi:membrane protease YdiL (CAAX protease family)
MRFKDLVRILLICFLFANTIGLIFITEWVQKVFVNWRQAIPLGLLIIGTECLIFARLLKPYQSEFSYRDVFSWKKLINGFLVGLVVWVALQFWSSRTFGVGIEFPSVQRVVKYGFIFLLNSFPNALIEEFIFRFLPVHYAEKKKLPRQKLILLGILAALIFSISHVSVYMLRDQNEWSELYFTLQNAFFYGMVYFFIYILTDNLFFTALIHAFGNNQLLLVNTPGFEPFYFYTFIFITLVWFAVRTFRKGFG